MLTIFASVAPVMFLVFFTSIWLPTHYVRAIFTADHINCWQCKKPTRQYHITLASKHCLSASKFSFALLKSIATASKNHYYCIKKIVQLPGIAEIIWYAKHFAGTLLSSILWCSAKCYQVDQHVSANWAVVCMTIAARQRPRWWRSYGGNGIISMWPFDSNLHMPTVGFHIGT